MSSMYGLSLLFGSCSLSLSSTTCTLGLVSCLVRVHYVSSPLVRSLLISGFIQSGSTLSSWSIIRCSSYLHLLTFVAVNCNWQPTQKNSVSQTMLSHSLSRA